MSCWRRCGNGCCCCACAPTAEPRNLQGSLLGHYCWHTTDVARAALTLLVQAMQSAGGQPTADAVADVAVCEATLAGWTVSGLLLAAAEQV